MRIYLSGILLVGALAAGCSSDRGQSPQQNANGEPGISAQLAAGLHPPMKSDVESTGGFASLPDRGELLQYAPDREVRRSGAYTHHPVAISEAHALNAMQAGALKLTAPDGTPLSIGFDRVEEHEDGNWSWIGHGEDGSRAVLTFGEQAVFGELVADGQSYQITTRAGTAWLVSTDATRLSGNMLGRHGDAADYLIAPEVGAEVVASRSMAAAGAKSVSAAASSAVVDVVLGYSDGLVASYITEQAAITRLTNLVAITNAAYQRSGVSMRIRLVGTVRVAFPDNSDNADVLRKLTGYNDSTGSSITPDPAFNALREARETYGADLVSFVRAHRPTEQMGCGIAWMIGAGGRAIVAGDAPFGYSVVGDGFGTGTDGHEYFCSSYSLAHELAHNMGQAHDEENVQRDAQNRPISGVHAYSYGYRETSSAGFHTIMAYPVADAQREAGYFANPAVNEEQTGRTTGVAGQSNNALSMNQTMPVVSQFKATIVPVRKSSIFDYNGDGRSDIVFQHPSAGLSIWMMNSNEVQSSAAVALPNGFSVVRSGDFNGDGLADLLISDGRNMRILLRGGSGQGYASHDFGYYADGWTPVAVGDVDGDGRDDVVFHNPNGNISYWLLDGPSVRSSRMIALPAGYAPLSHGDYNGDGRLDFIVSNGSNMLMWLGNGTVFPGYGFGHFDAGWQLAASIDVNADGISDLVWYRPATGLVSVWVLNANTVSRSFYAGMPSGYRLDSVGDYNGDGRWDMLLSDGRQMLMWLGSGTAFPGYGFGYYDSGWKPINLH